MHTMFKFTVLFFVLCLTSFFTTAQTAETVYNKYTDYNLARLQGETGKSLKLGEALMPDAGKLPEKTLISFYNSIAKLYEDANQLDKAQPLYEKVAAAAPDYYVVHLALGHIYLRTANALGIKINASKGDKAAYESNRAAYIAAVNKVLPHLEKVQACDPYDENLNLIKKLYNNINNPAGFAGLNDRLKTMRGKCLDILSDN